MGGSSTTPTTRGLWSTTNVAILSEICTGAQTTTWWKAKSSSWSEAVSSSKYQSVSATSARTYRNWSTRGSWRESNVR